MAVAPPGIKTAFQEERSGKPKRQKSFRLVRCLILFYFYILSLMVYIPIFFYYKNWRNVLTTLFFLLFFLTAVLRCKLYTIKFTLFIYNSMSFKILENCIPVTVIQFQSISITPEKILHAYLQSLSIPTYTPGSHYLSLKSFLFWTFHISKII